MEFAASLPALLSFPSGAFIDPTRNPFTQAAGGGSKEGDSCQPKPQRPPTTITRWRVDGCGSCGTQLFIIPLFLGEHVSPLRIDAIIPDQTRHSPSIRERLQSGRLCYTTDREAANVPLAQHILYGLDAWIDREDALGERFRTLPFGSRVLIEEITPDPFDMNIAVDTRHDFERKMESIGSLKEKWNLPESLWPPAIDLGELHLCSQIKDSISLVRFASETEPERLIFKSNTRELHFLYHELKVLLTMPHHPNIISRPTHIVTKHCCFGGKKGVCGFLLPFYSKGSLDAVLTNQLPRETLPLYLQFKWARQTISALKHIRESVHGYYSELRLDNILISSRDGEEDVVLADFETRGSRGDWSPPEVHWLQETQHLANSPSVPEAYKKKCSDWLVMHRCKSSLPPNGRYQDIDLGYDDAWKSFSRAQQESATVYMIGKLLWCLFESSDSVKNRPWSQRSSSARVEFPEFSETPDAMRPLILHCTEGAPERQAHFEPMARIGDRLVPKALQYSSTTEACTLSEVQKAAKDWWQEELKRMEHFHTTIADSRAEHQGEQFYNGGEPFFTRPSLDQVMEMIEELERNLQPAPPESKAPRF
ncbi:MAG: hypothetical protein M1820_002499 [Bogoriella megaspora]|nr:MAG: hypothetical protein M1820_002499 [Bogoriella megaspora]